MSMIGWVDLLHSKVSTKFRDLQHAHCIMAGTRISWDNWIIQFIWQLPNVSHAQWLYRNFTLHYHTKGFLCQLTEREIGQEAKLLADAKPSDIPKESHFLLDIPFKPSRSSLVVDDAYWVLAMKSAKKFLPTRERVMAGQGARAKQWVLKASRNLLDRVEDSL